MNISEIIKENLINLYNDKGEKHGYWEEYNSNGQLLYKGNYVNGVEHGYWEEYWFNGRLCYKGNYVDGKLHGSWEIYNNNNNNNGQLIRKCYFDMGKKIFYNPDEPKIVELTITDIANKLGVDVDKLRIKE